jgi:hypothetical protein
LIELSFIDHGLLKSEGRPFSCHNCTDRIKNLRRCGEDREDFTEADGSLWPIQLSEGGELFGFCPAKASWDVEICSQFNLLTIAAESGNVLLYDGCMLDQPTWWIEALTWFLPRYDQNKFISRAKMILGDGKKAKTTGSRSKANGGNRKPSL